jgi:hypothetical protein
MQLETKLCHDIPVPTHHAMRTYRRKGGKAHCSLNLELDEGKRL